MTETGKMANETGLERTVYLATMAGTKNNILVAGKMTKDMCVFLHFY